MTDHAAVELNNVTLYVAPADFAAVRDFYLAVLGAPVFEEPGHIACFGAGPERSVCVHEAGELGRGPAEVEVIYWVDDVEAFRRRLAPGLVRRELAGGALEVTDPAGRPLRFQERPRPGP